MAENSPAMNMSLEQAPPKEKDSEPTSTNASQGPSSTASSRFRMVAMGAMRTSQSPSVNGSTANGSAPNLQTLPETPSPAVPSETEKPRESASAVSAATPVSSESVGSAKSGPLNKSKLIYDIARTKMLTQRTLYRLSSETGFIKLRSKPVSKPTGAHSSASAITGHTSESAAQTNGAGAEAEANAGSAAFEQKPVAGWKQQGLIDSGKKAPPAAQPSMFDTLAVYVEMLDGTGMWRNCAGVFGLMFLTYVLTALNFGIVGFAIAAVYGGKYMFSQCTP
ncbi:hypothetical protein GGF43_004572, partial [Coemansia sp. RSA 2618]